MDRDEWRNLGLGGVGDGPPPATAEQQASSVKKS